MNYSITKNGKELDKSLYIIDKVNEVFSSKENDLVLDFPGQYDWNFKTGSNCVFTTGAYCTFETGSGCKFKTDSNCLFNTGSDCTILSWNRGKCLPFIIKEAGIYKIEEGKLININEETKEEYIEIKEEYIEIKEPNNLKKKDIKKVIKILKKYI